MRLIFAGTPEFARVALSHLLAAGHEVLLVLTQPDRPAGRGMKLQASPVKVAALAAGIPVCQPLSLRLDGRYASDAALAQTAITQAIAQGAQAMIVAAYGLILPQWVLQAPPLGCLNIHASLLPRWRGAAPIHRAIEAGDRQTGVTIMQMDEGLDTGAMLLSQTQAIDDTATTGSLHDQLALLGAQSCESALQALQNGTLPALAQPEAGVSYAAKIAKAEAQIDWQRDATTLSRQIRAFNPAPGAWSDLGEDTVKIWQAYVETSDANSTTGTAPELANQSVGTVLSADAGSVRVLTGQGILCLTELQRAGSKRMPLSELLRGKPIQPGERFGHHATLDSSLPKA